MRRTYLIPRLLSRRTWAALVCAGILAGCSKPAPTPDDLLATVGGSEIRMGDFEQELVLQSRRGGTPPSYAAVLEEMIHRQALVNQAMVHGLHEDPELRRAWQNLLIAAFKERELEPRLEQIQVDAREVENLAAQARATAAANPIIQSRVALLFQPVHRSMSEARQAEARTRLAEAALKAKELPASELSFGALAIDFSEDQATRFKGGDLGWLDHSPGRHSYPSNLLSAVFSLEQKGEIIGPIEASEGYYLVRLMDRRSGNGALVQTDPAVLSHTIHLQRRKAVEQEFLEAVLQSQNVVLTERGMALPIRPEPDAHPSGAPPRPMMDQ